MRWSIMALCFETLIPTGLSMDSSHTDLDSGRNWKFMGAITIWSQYIAVKVQLFAYPQTTNSPPRISWRFWSANGEISAWHILVLRKEIVLVFLRVSPNVSNVFFLHVGPKFCQAHDVPHLGLAMQVVTIHSHSPNLLGSMDSYWLRTTHNFNRQAINSHRIDLIWIEVTGTIGKKNGPILLATGHSDFSIRCRRYTRHCSRPHPEKIAALSPNLAFAKRCRPGHIFIKLRWKISNRRHKVTWPTWRFVDGDSGKGSWSLSYIGWGKWSWIEWELNWCVGQKVKAAINKAQFVHLRVVVAFEMKGLWLDCQSVYCIIWYI